MKRIKIEKSWSDLLKHELSKIYFTDLIKDLAVMYNNKQIFPPFNQIFNTLNLTSVDKIKVIIVGQDPYHGLGQAHGLAFSVSVGVKIPPSLLNIYKELKSDIGKDIPISGFLESWSKQGVLLLNSVLTVESGKPNSHKNIGWEKFTESIINIISKQKPNLVFILWGKYAQKKEEFISKNNQHLILKSAHPSPLSAYNGFFGCKHFSKTNSYLKSNNIKEILW